MYVVRRENLGKSRELMLLFNGYKNINNKKNSYVQGSA